MKRISSYISSILYGGGTGMSTTQMFEQGLKFHTMIKLMILINYSKILILSLFKNINTIFIQKY